MLIEDYIAHVRENDKGGWLPPHSLLEHLEQTAKLAADFAKKFKSEQFAYQLGIFHDLGKGTEEWQKYIRDKSGFKQGADEAHLEDIKDAKLDKIEHSIIGAQIAEEYFGKWPGRIFSYCIAGHHGGLPDFYAGTKSKRGDLKMRLTSKSNRKTHNKLQDLYTKENINFKPLVQFDKNLACALWVRMLFSCLVDADFLDTEKYMNPYNFKLRGNFDRIEVLYEKLIEHLNTIVEKAEQNPVNTIRKNILEDCFVAADKKQGIFTLTVPTGGGKTLSSLAFALKHAKKHKLDRVIYVIPFNSIVEQTANVFKAALGMKNVIEHHSNIDESDVTPEMRLASENWDAPIIITTNVQFFESLFAAKTSKTRKLHNIVKSVVILDEAQMMPTEYLKPILTTLKLLAEYFFVTIVVCTATQPVFESRKIGNIKFDGLKEGSSQEIVRNINFTYKQLNRVDYKVINNADSPLELSELACYLEQHKQVLCIVPDRKTCRDLYEMMSEKTIHLSALMCGEHRSEVIAKIKKALKNNEPIKVVSTQLVEAGVDIDFPVVYKSIAGLDSIIQAAGRCNREGKLQKGEVYIFHLKKKPPMGMLRKAYEVTSNIFLQMDEENEKNLSSFKNIENFFLEYYWKANSLDEKNIIESLTPSHDELSMSFRTAAEDFKMIDDSKQRTIVVRYRDSISLLDNLKIKIKNKIFIETRSILRNLQRYTVNVYVNDFERLLSRRSIEEVLPGVWALTTELEYDQKKGLCIDEFSVAAEAFIL